MVKVTDPRAVPSILAIFVDAKETHQSQAVMMLSQIDAATASKALALLGLGTAYPEVRRLAAESLRRRDPREYADLVIA